MNKSFLEKYDNKLKTKTQNLIEEKRPKLITSFHESSCPKRWKKSGVIITWINQLFKC